MEIPEVNSIINGVCGRGVGCGRVSIHTYRRVRTHLHTHTHTHTFVHTHRHTHIQPHTHATHIPCFPSPSIHTCRECVDAQANLFTATLYVIRCSHRSTMVKHQVLTCNACKDANFFALQHFEQSCTM